MESLSQQKLRADIESSWARAALDYETARKTRIESRLYPVVVSGGLMGGGAAIVGAIVVALRLYYGAS